MSRKPLAFLIIVLASMAAAPHSSAQGSDVAVVVNPANPISNLTLADLRKLLSGEKRLWAGHVPVKLIVRVQGSHERTVLLRFLNMTEGEYRQYWTAQVFRGEADAAPFDIPSIGMLMEAIKTFPGALTLVDTKDVKPGMKVVKLEGLLPDSPGYLLH